MQIKIDGHDAEELKIYLDAIKNYCFISELYDHLFRPAYKHGYGNEQIDNLITNNEDCVKVVEYLAQRYLEYQAERFNQYDYMR